MAIPWKFHPSGNRGIKERQFDIPQGSRKIKSNAQGFSIFSFHLHKLQKFPVKKGIKLATIIYNFDKGLNSLKRADFPIYNVLEESRCDKIYSSGNRGV